MNQLSNNVISRVTNMNNFLTAEYKPGAVSGDKFDRLNHKFIYLIQNQDIDKNYGENGPIRKSRNIRKSGVDQQTN